MVLLVLLGKGVCPPTALAKTAPISSCTLPLRRYIVYHGDTCGPVPTGTFSGCFKQG